MLQSKERNSTCNQVHPARRLLEVERLIRRTAFSGANRRKFWLVGRCAAFGLLGLGLLGFGVVSTNPVDRPKPQPVPAVALMVSDLFDDTAQDVVSNAPKPIEFYGFALNALLLPLLDDSDPPRWDDVAVAFACGPGTSILVDGKPMVPGTPIPPKTFTVRWVMDECSPFGRESVELTGGVELVVTRGDLGFSAVVKPDRLRVSHHIGRAGLHVPFVAQATLGKQFFSAQPKTAPQ